MKTLLVSSLIFLLALSLSARAESLYLAVGQSTTLPVAQNSPIGLGDGNIVKIRDQGAKLQILGKSKGMTWLQIGARRYQINVQSARLIEFYHALSATLKQFKGLTAEISAEGQIQISGTLLRMSDLQQLSQLALRHNQPFEMRTQIHPTVRPQVEGWVAGIAQSIGLRIEQFQLTPEFKVDLVGEKTEKSALLQSQLRKRGFKVEYNNRRVSHIPSVQLEIVIAEVDKTFERELGIRWGDGGKYTTQVLPQAQWSALNAELTALESEGSGQILAKPRLISRSGEKAEFHAGGEIPIRIAGWGSQNVQWKKHGIIMSFQPEADHTGAMKLQVEVEISIPNLSQMVGQLPTFETNRVRSQFDLAKKERLCSLVSFENLNHKAETGSHCCHKSLS
jgi:Flp pilus assembly secretin CpaC